MTRMEDEFTRYRTKLGKNVAGAESFFKRTIGEARKKFGEVVEEVKADGKRAVEKLDKEVLPKACKKLGEAGTNVLAHVELTARVAGASIIDAATRDDPKAKDERSARELRMAKSLVREKVYDRKGKPGPFKTYLASEEAVIENFDNTGEEAKGIAVYPRGKRLTILKDEFVPVRIFISADGGLTSREYVQNKKALEDPKQAQYTLKGKERATTAEDLFALQITAHEIGTILDARYNKFQAARSGAGSK